MKKFGMLMLGLSLILSVSGSHAEAKSFFRVGRLNPKGVVRMVPIVGKKLSRFKLTAPGRTARSFIKMGKIGNSNLGMGWLAQGIGKTSTKHPFKLFSELFGKFKF